MNKILLVAIACCAVVAIACSKVEEPPARQAPPPPPPLKINQARLRGFWYPFSVTQNGMTRTVEFQTYNLEWTPSNTIRCTRVGNDSIIGNGTYSVQSDSLQMSLVLNGIDSRFANLSLLTGSYRLILFDGDNKWTMESTSSNGIRFTMAPKK